MLHNHHHQTMSDGYKEMTRRAPILRGSGYRKFDIGDEAGVKTSYLFESNYNSDIRNRSNIPVSCEYPL